MNEKITLLTGAGFTKNFGGLLAEEMWAAIFNHEKIQKSNNVKNLMLTFDNDSGFDNFDYEHIYYEILSKPKYSDNDRDAIKTAVSYAYKFQENNILGTNCENNHIIQPFFNFVERNVYRLFTLNQDLFIEQHSRDKMPKRKMSFVGSPTTHNAHVHVTKELKLPNEKELLAQKQDIEQLLKKEETLGYIKLHGSSNWLDSEGKGNPVLGIGIKKVAALIKEPLIRWYFELFQQLLNENAHLLVIGYSFLDEHINKFIYDAMVNNSLKIHVVDYLSPKKYGERMQKVQKNGNIYYEDARLTRNNKKYRAYIWKNLSGYFSIKSIASIFGDDSAQYNKLLLNNLGV